MIIKSSRKNSKNRVDVQPKEEKPVEVRRPQSRTTRSEEKKQPKKRSLLEEVLEEQAKTE